ncbi:MAG: hypothetical protein RLZZ175_3362 [Bacteroidota bacterium]|jgi:hypothetical protein
MAAKNLFTAELAPGQSKSFDKRLTWLSVGPQDPEIDTVFQINGIAEEAGDICRFKNQAFTTPENCEMEGITVENVSGSNINVIYRY